MYLYVCGWVMYIPSITANRCYTPLQWIHSLIYYLGCRRLCACESWRRGICLRWTARCGGSSARMRMWTSSSVTTNRYKRTPIRCAHWYCCPVLCCGACSCEKYFLYEWTVHSSCFCSTQSIIVQYLRKTRKYHITVILVHFESFDMKFRGYRVRLGSSFFSFHVPTS